MDRRTFLRRAGAVGLSGALGSLLAACSGGGAAKPPVPTGRIRTGLSPSSVHEADGMPVADWVVAENAHPGRSYEWIIPRRLAATTNPAIEGFLDHVSAVAGDTIRLYVNTVSPTFRAYVYRIGYYDGYGGRRIAVSPELKGVRQPAAKFDAATNTVECNWTVSWTTTVGPDWPPGAYLIRLEGSRTEQQYVPFLVRDDKSHSSYLVQSSVTTWQAYNPYGGYSLYGGTPIGSLSDYESRSRVVSFDRPYSHIPHAALDARGSGDFLGNEFPLIYLLERHGLDVSYWTDVDLHERSGLLDNHRCLISLGHDEYWSMDMRNAVLDAVKAGKNVAFLGANACYRQIRFERSSLGIDRRVVCYKDAEEDPILASHPALATGLSWSTDPVPWDESALIGVMYQNFGGSGPLVVADSASWVFAGTGLKNGDKIEKVIGSEFDAFEPRLTNPPSVQILGHSPTASNSGPGYFSDMSYYSLPSGGAVFASGTASWVSQLWDGARRAPARLGFGVPEPSTLKPLTTITLNVLRSFGSGSAGHRHPSVENWRQFYAPNAPTKPVADVSI